jgi:biotin/methionine sulfoxide reductase
VALKRNGREQARLHPSDATALGIADGQTIRIWNARGACLATAQIANTVRQGVIVLPTGAWFTPRGDDGLEVAGNPNVLTLDIGTSQFGQGCSAHTCLVRVEPHSSNQHDAFEEYQEKLVALAAV